jgi:CSLREA domain-containing protein
MGRSLCVAMTIAVVTLASGPAYGVDFTVDTTLDAVDANPGDGSCATAVGDCSLRAAIMESNALAGTDRVLLGAATYTLTLAGADEDDCLTGDLDIRDTIEIGGVAADVTTIDANGIDRVIQTIGLSSGQTVTLYDLAITGGAAVTATTYSGGGIEGETGNHYLARVHVHGNSANTGAGVYIAFGTGIVINSTISGNTLVNVGVTNMYGSGIKITQASGILNLDSSTVSGNLGGLSTVVGQQGATVLVRNSTISGNDGRGVSNSSGELEIVNSTIVGNRYGGVSFGSATGTHTITMYNTILADHTTYGYPNCNLASGITVLAGNLEDDDSCEFDAGQFSDTDPMLGPLTANGGDTLTHRPAHGSPAIDAGESGSPYCRSFDQRGVARPIDGDGNGSPGCDIGSVEVAEFIFADGFEDGDTLAWN